MKRFSSIFPFVFIVAALLGILWPMLRPGFYVSDDGEWMVIRLSAFYQSLADGQLPVRFLGRLNNSYGYPVASFLYPGFLYIGSLLHLVGFSFVSSVKLIMAFSVVGAAILLYVPLRRSYTWISSLLGTLSFIASPYLLYDLYKRGSVGEVLAFLPASAGIYSIITNKRWLFSLSVASLIVSHNTLAVLFIGVLLMFIIGARRQQFLWSLLVGVGLASFFWIPALVEKRYVRFDLVNVSDPRAYMLQGKNFWMIGIASVIAACILLFTKGKKIDRVTLTALVLYGISTLLALPVSSIVWLVRPLSAIVQFPFRFLAIGVLVSPWFVAAAADRLKRHIAEVAAILVLILAVPVWNQLTTISFVTREKGYYETNEGTTTVADEYLPRWVYLKRSDHAPDRLVFEKGRGRIVYEYLNTQRVVASIDALEESVLRFHTIYYPGWGITIDGKPVPVTYENPHGFMEVSVPAGTHKVEAEFRETVSRFFADVVSVGSFVVWGILLLKGMKRS